MSAAAPVLLTGATGHIGGALLKRLLAEGRTVRCVVRDPSKLDLQEGTVEVVEADLNDRGALGQAFEPGCVAYFLVHALSAGTSLASEERALAENFARAASDAKAARIVYLGGLVDEDDPDLSPHMASRVEVGRILAASGVPTIEFRASIVIGDGSFSFELIRKLVGWVPVIALPSWADNLAQPIAVDDVVSYLEAAARIDLDGSKVFEIGGADQLSYRALIEKYAEYIGSLGFIVTVSAPEAAIDAVVALAAPMLDLLPGETQEALKLLESLRHSTVVNDRRAGEIFDVHPMGIGAAIERAVPTKESEDPPDFGDRNNAQTSR